ncbi:S8 family serine peptidase [Micromonospora sp. NPDC050200]|uniref:S8 family serine peptidase n=1 Tax=Micromonospora sp. NPDC050200 TaxID=3155664 RepID=UPI00340883E7
MAITLVASAAVSGTAAAAQPSAPASTASPAASAAQSPAASTGDSIVTLVTGDRVTTRGTGIGLQVLDVEPGPNREDVSFTRVRLNDHELVIPSDTADLYGADRIDRRLLDVTALTTMGLGDRSRADIPLLLRAAPDIATRAGLIDVTDLSRVGLTAGTVAKQNAATAWSQLRAAAESGDLAQLRLDGTVKATLDESVPRSGAPKAWKRGLTGAGVTVAVLDTGYDMEHPDLHGLVVGSKDFVNEGTVDDKNGHGTHVSSTIAGTGAASGDRYTGMAPGVKLLEGKVLNKFGSGSESGIIQGMVWAVEQDADIVNMSLGASVPDAGRDSLSQVLNALSASSDTLFVVAAGNDGAPETVGSPGAADAALTVGSVTKTGARSPFSSQGPRSYDLAIKPDITAPGSDIVAARAAGTYPASAVDTYYSRLSGTSMATPHVAGAAALLAQKHPDWDGEHLKAALVGAADGNIDVSPFAQGAGELDVDEATATDVVATTDRPATATLPAAAPSTWTFGYRNVSNHPLTLSLSVSLRDSDTGSAAPAGLVTLPSASLRLAPGEAGTATATVAASMTRPGKYAGWVVATAPGGMEVRTPVAVVVAPPMHNVTLVRPTPRATANLAFLYTVIQNEQTGYTWFNITNATPSVVSLPEGSYRVYGHTYETDLGSNGKVLATRSTHFAQHIVVDKDVRFSPDLSHAAPVRMGLTGTVARLASGSVGVLSRLPMGVQGLVAPTMNEMHQVYAAPSGPIPGVEFLNEGGYFEPFVTARSGADTEWALTSTASQPWVGRLTARVVDVGAATDAEIARAGVSGAIALATFPTSVPFATRGLRVTALANAGAKAVVLADQYATSTALPVFVLASQQVPAFAAAVATGSLTLDLVGTDTPREAAFVVQRVQGEVPAGADFRQDASQLAASPTTLPALGVTRYGNTIMSAADLDGLLIGDRAVVRVPSTVRILRTPGLAWTTSIRHYTFEGEGGGSVPLGWMDSEPTTYAAGSVTPESYLGGPFNPSLSIRSNPAPDALPYVYRTEDEELRFGLPMFSDSAGHRTGNTTVTDTGDVTLTDDAGVTIAASDAVGRLTAEGLSPREAWYRLTSHAKRTFTKWPLGTDVTSTWRFRSGHVAQGYETLPLIDLTYQLAYDGQQSVAAGQAVQLSLTAGHQVGARARATHVQGVEYSTDGGKTWSPASAQVDGASAVATLPGVAAGNVSLRTTAVDDQGGSLVEIIMDAYRVHP